MSKVVFISWDSAEPALLNRWLADGSLPNLKQLKERSQAVEDIRALSGMGHAVFWNSLSTGLNPGEHGEYGFRQLIPGTYNLIRFDIDADLQGTPFWVDISKAGSKVAIVDVPKSLLTSEIKGIQLTDWTSFAQTGVPRSHPPDYIQTVSDTLGSDPFGGRSDQVRTTAEDFNAYFDKVIKRIAIKTKFTCQLLQDPENFDFLMVVFGDSHEAGHFTWHLNDSHHPRYDPTVVAECGNVLKAVYIELDQALGRVLSVMKEDASVVFFAGPGTGPNYTAGHLLPQILHRLQQPVLFNQTGISSQLFKFNDFWSNNKFASKVRNKLNRLQPSKRKIKQQLKELRQSGRRISSFPTSVAQQAFFALPYHDNAGAIRINLREREPDGKITMGQSFETAMEFLETELKALRNTETGEPIVREIIRVKGTYSGRHSQSFPDLLALWNRTNPIASVTSPRIGKVEGRLYDLVRPGDHTENTLLLTPKSYSTLISPPATVYEVGRYLTKLCAAANR
ncbi:MAG: alkaline phosphatase family protein [Cyanobacteria bacterium P01_H01_bin.15]